MEKGLISIIIPVYNTEQYIDRCLTSIIKSDYNFYEVILINDGSIDRSQEICEKYCNLDQRFRLINQENHGVSVARNNGLQYSNGEWIVFVDSDDYISADFLSYIAKQENDNYDVIFFDCDFGEQKSGTYEKECVVYKKENNLSILDKTLKSQYLTEAGDTSLRGPWAKAYRSALIKQYHIQFNEDLAIGEDLVFNMEVYYRMQASLHIRRTVYYIECRQGSATHSFDTKIVETYMRLNQEVDRILHKHEIFEELKYAYEDNILSGMLWMLVQGIFGRSNTENYKKKKEICSLLYSQKMCQDAMKERLRYADFSTKVVLYLFKYKMYKGIEIVCWLRRKLERWMGKC